MKIVFRLTWAKGSAGARAFKSKETFSLFSEYCERIGRFSSCEVGGGAESWKKNAGVLVWMCDRARKARPLSSEDVAAALDSSCSAGARELHILIGGADGFTEKDDALWKPDLRWSFGPLTLPHELASVVAAEQVYRAWTILKKHPYHQGH
ncbi:MAG TPA: 23S rRNA (pseudouridine(1915)-N(3))-methyltransferase RlmH [Verrucomicrobiae bacterium]|jgi:23S rRNA (pseudouridine1915-N3)-methyltransferase|nr:23S rRNA (pseudouridine(1915)-N(3))-methyltransferase RlmH [Verrucomicrobiae bacterium]